MYPVALYEVALSVWNSCRGNHLGQRSCASAPTGRTYGRKRSDQNTAKTPCEEGAVHIWVRVCAVLPEPCVRRARPPLPARDHPLGADVFPRSQPCDAGHRSEWRDSPAGLVPHQPLSACRAPRATISSSAVGIGRALRRLRKPRPITSALPTSRSPDLWRRWPSFRRPCRWQSPHWASYRTKSRYGAMRRPQGYCWRLKHWSSSGWPSRHEIMSVLVPAPGPRVLMVLEVGVVVCAIAGVAIMAAMAIAPYRCDLIVSNSGSLWNH